MILNRAAAGSNKEVSVPMYFVGFSLVPTKRAQENGETEKILVAPTAVVAKDRATAVAVVAARNGVQMSSESNVGELQTYLLEVPTSA